MEEKISRKILYDGVLNCPFCGSLDISLSTHDDDNAFHPKYFGVAECENCGCEISTEYFDKEYEANERILEIWNRRYYHE